MSTCVPISGVDAVQHSFGHHYPLDVTARYTPLTADLPAPETVAVAATAAQSESSTSRSMERPAPPPEADPASQSRTGKRGGVGELAAALGDA